MRHLPESPTPLRDLRPSLVALVWLLALSTGAPHPLPADERTVVAEPATTVRGLFQTWPGGPMAEAEAPVRRSPTALPIAAAAAAQLDDDDLVLGIVLDDRARAYPIRYLAAHEVIADRIAGVAVAPTWCPLTASGVVFARRLGERELTFDFVRGLINDNLLISDRETRSVWSQLKGVATSGPLAGERLEVVPSMQTTWAFWRRRHPQTEVLIVDGSPGFPYRYFPSEVVRMPPPRSAEHDLVSVGLGLMVWGQPAFFPLGELAKATTNPFVIGSGSTAIRVHHDAEGKTAWAETAGELLPAVLAYERGWKAFHPHSRVFDAALDCDPGSGR